VALEAVAVKRKTWPGVVRQWAVGMVLVVGVWGEARELWKV
jgi:hypothetical protein